MEPLPHTELSKGILQRLAELEALVCDKPRWGLASRPADESVRVGQWPFLNFALRECAQVLQEGGLTRLYVQNFGLLGPQGALPLHLTEYVQSRVHHHRDLAFMEFLNLFHHRMYLLFYRAWANTQAHVAWRAEDCNPFTVLLADLSGHGVEAFAAQGLGLGLRRVGAVGELTRVSRCRENVEMLLRQVWGCAVRVLDFQGRWQHVERHQQWALGLLGPSLGGALILGPRVLDLQSRVCIEYGPLDWTRFQAWVLPEPKAPCQALDTWAASALGLEWDWEHHFLLRADEVPACVLGGRQAKFALGLSTCLGAWRSPRPLRVRRAGRWPRPEPVTTATRQGEVNEEV